MKRIDIVIPLFNEEETVNELIPRLQQSADNLDCSFRFIFVDDGSVDGTLGSLLRWQRDDPRVVVVQLSRNWGHQSAFNAGIAHADADAVVLMDGDLEDPPELIADMIAKWREGFEIVTAVKRSRQETRFKKLCFSTFHWALQRFSSVSMERNAGMFSLLGRRPLIELQKLGEHNKYYPGLRSFLGYSRTTIEYDRCARPHGQPKQSFMRLVQLGSDALFAFSFLPIKALTLVGVFISLCAFALSVLLVLFWFFDWQILFMRRLPGWTTLALALLFGIGTQMIFLGVIGEYVARILDEVRKRPDYLVDTVYDNSKRKEQR